MFHVFMVIRGRSWSHVHAVFLSVLSMPRLHCAHDWQFPGQKLHTKESIYRMQRLQSTRSRIDITDNLHAIFA